MFRRTFGRFVSAADLQNKLLKETKIAPAEALVKDMSSGCGSFFHVTVTSPAFAGKSMVQQHRMVHDILREEIKVIHGLQIVCNIPK
jgi:stress-induced morphogen